MFYNYTRQLPCYDYAAGVNPDTAKDGLFWDFQFCTEMFQPMSRDGVKDMFFPQVSKDSVETSSSARRGSKPCRR